MVNKDMSWREKDSPGKIISEHFKKEGGQIFWNTQLFFFKKKESKIITHHNNLNFCLLIRKYFNILFFNNCK